MKRPGHWGEDPDSNRRYVRLWSWNPVTIWGVVALVVVVLWKTGVLP